MSSLQWTFLGVGLGFLLLGASLIVWADEIEQRVTVEGNIYVGGGWIAVCGVLFLIGVGATGVGSFTSCFLKSEEGLGELVGDAVWLGIASGLLVHGVRTRSGGEIGVTCAPTSSPWPSARAANFASRREPHQKRDHSR